MSTQTGNGLERRQFLAMGVGAFVVASLPLAARRHERLVRRTLPVMGTIAELAVAHRSVQRAEEAIDAAMATLVDVERTMTRFAPTSDIGRANLAAMHAAVPVRPDTALVVAEALRWADATDGAYDPAIGGAVELWDVTHRHEPPPSERVARLAARQLHRAIEVDARRGVLRFHDPDARLDLGSIAKGYGVDRAAQTLRERGITSALVNVGGDLYALGRAPDGAPWRVGIQDPDDSRALLDTVDAADVAIATSGTYMQFFRYHGRRYHHLLDPRTAEPNATAVRSLTIRADSCMHADVAATALYGMEARRAARVLERRAPGGRIVRIA